MISLLIALQAVSAEAAPAPPAPTALQNVTIPGETSDIVVQARKHDGKKDPFEALNAKSFALTQGVDDAVTRPVALAYKKNLPEPVRDGVRNFLGNVKEPVVFLNFVAQHKIGKAGETLGRFVVNSTVGVAGLFDVAKRQPINLPRRVNGLAYTLGYYGVKPGPYFFIPLFGPTTLRDAIGEVADRLVLPMGVGVPFNSLAYSAPTGALSAVDRRAEFDADLEEIRASGDPYLARREYYLHKRQREIDALKGKKTLAVETVPKPVELAAAAN